MDNFENMDWEAPSPAFDYTAEMKKIRKSLRKRNFLIVCTCLALVAILAFGFVRFGIPALEKQYWDPTISTYMEGVPDFQLTMGAYTELFCPQYNLFSIEIAKSGFATYDITTIFSKWTSNNTIANSVQPARSATICKDELSFSAGFWDQRFDSPLNGNTRIDQFWTTSAVKYLKKYPEYISVLAAVTFPEDLTVRESYIFSGTSAYDVIWCAVRSGEDDSGAFPVCGFTKNNLYSGAYRHAFRSDSEYPYLIGVESSIHTETHFRSMLRFLQDQLDQGTGFLPPDCENENYYTEVLDYVEENGVMVYGAYIISSPQALLELYNSGKINGIGLCDAWINY